MQIAIWVVVAVAVSALLAHCVGCLLRSVGGRYRAPGPRARLVIPITDEAQYICPSCKRAYPEDARELGWLCIDGKDTLVCLPCYRAQKHGRGSHESGS